MSPICGNHRDLNHNRAAYWATSISKHSAGYFDRFAGRIGEIEFIVADS